MSLKESIARKYNAVRHVLDERGRRIWAAAEAREIGWGGQTLVSEATGIARHTIRAGMAEIDSEDVGPPPSRIRAVGAGRKRAEDRDPELLGTLNAILEPGTRGDPMSPLRWTTKSVRNLAEALQAAGHQIERTAVRGVLRRLGYSLQGTRKTTEGNQHPDRNAQFERINEAVGRFIAAGNPAVSVDAKKKELVGDFKQGGREWRPKGKPIPVRVHDFIDRELGKVAPYGVYDIGRNTGWVSVGVSADTGDFSTAAIRRWWERIGEQGYPDATEILITADGGGSNGYRLRSWKVGLQALADDIGLPITVMHLPPGTSKWNKIEHRMFCHMTEQFRGRPLLTREVIVELIAHTSTREGLSIVAELDDTTYLTGLPVPDEVMECLNIIRHEFHGEWNYTIHPNV